MLTGTVCIDICINIKIVNMDDDRLLQRLVKFMDKPWNDLPLLKLS